MSEKLKEVIMPLMGEGITEATLVKWLKQPGDRVEAEEPLLEVSTDKVDTEVPAPHAGFLVKTYAKAGEQIEVNATIAYLSDDPNAEAPASVTNSGSSSNKAVEQRTPAASTSFTAPPPQLETQPQGAVRSSPLVRKIARDMNLNLGAVTGRGLHGRITKPDVLNFIEKVVQQAGLGQLSGGQPAATKLATTLRDGTEYLEGVPVRREPMSKMRRLTAEHMVRSVATSPHVTTTFEIDMHKLVNLREKHQAEFLKREGFKLTFTHLITHAVIKAIIKNPIVNCSVDGDDILHKDDINIGLAVAIETGLIVPVIKRSNKMSLVEVAQATQDIVSRARSKRLNPDDVQGGTFSITNPGLFGSLNSNPIINQPQVAILSVGAIIERPVVVAGDITTRPLIHIGLTFDHRVIDGEGGAKFLADLKQIIETYAEPVT